MNEYFNSAFVTKAERDLYQKYASEYSGLGKIVDAGCFLGGTTNALCEGISAELESPPIISLDRFLVADSYIAEFFAKAGLDVRMGDSFLPIFIENIRRNIHLVEIRAGDILGISRITGNIEILSIDIAKSSGINSQLIISWFPLLIPKLSVLIHQDFFAPSQPWLAASMGPLLDYFSIDNYKTGESASFRLQESIPSTALRTAARVDWRTPNGLACLEKVHDAFGEPFNRSIKIMIAKSLMAQGRIGEAQNIVVSLCGESPAGEDGKWKQWLGMAVATMHPSLASPKRLLAEVYDDDMRFRLGHW